MTAPISHDPATWSWLEDTNWCVSPASLPALRYDQDGNGLTWRVDQTVWHITGCREGYFWGVCSAILRDAGETAPARGQGSQPRGFTMLGSASRGALCVGRCPS